MELSAIHKTMTPHQFVVKRFWRYSCHAYVNATDPTKIAELQTSPPTYKDCVLIQHHHDDANLPEHHALPGITVRYSDHSRVSVEHPLPDSVDLDHVTQVWRTKQLV